MSKEELEKEELRLYLRAFGAHSDEQIEAMVNSLTRSMYLGLINEYKKGIKEIVPNIDPLMVAKSYAGFREEDFNTPILDCLSNTRKYKK